MAIQTAYWGAPANTLQLPDAVRVTSTGGMSKHEKTMNKLQTFSHCQRPRKRIGSVKNPFITPERIASSAPAITIFSIGSASQAAEKPTLLKGTGFSPSIKPLETSAALAAEGSHLYFKRMFSLAAC
jgi:hypothetical protein